MRGGGELADRDGVLDRNSPLRFLKGKPCFLGDLEVEDSSMKNKMIIKYRSFTYCSPS